MLGSASAAPGGIGTLPASGNGLSQGTLGWSVRVEDLDSDGPQESCHRTWQLERVSEPVALHLQTSAGRKEC